MLLPKNDWYPLALLADELKISIENLDAYLGSGQIKPSVYYNGVNLLFEVTFDCDGDAGLSVSSYKEADNAEEGIYQIVNYWHIRWSCDVITNHKTVNLNEFHNVYLYRNNKYYSPAHVYTINKDDLVVTLEELNHFLAGDEIAGKPLFDAKDFIIRGLAEGKTKYEIIVELVEEHGNEKTKFYGTIARVLFPNYSQSNDNAVWRKRGKREYEKAKKALTSKNATLPPSIISP